MRSRVLVFIAVAVATVIIITASSVVMATTLGNETISKSEGASPTTTLVTTTPDVASAEAAVAEQIDNFYKEVERQKAEQEAAAAAVAVVPKVAPNYDPGDGSRWDQLAICESGGNWAYPPVAGGFSGGIMFHIGTWRANGGLEFAPDAYLATREQQIVVAERVLAASGWGAWPGCSRRYGWL